MKEKDGFEDEIREIRAELDVYEAPVGKWKEIEKQVFKHSNVSTGVNWWRIAASILLFVSVSMGYFLIQTNRGPNSLSDLSPAYQQLEMKYQHEIDQTYASLQLGDIDTRHVQWLLEELTLIDSMQNEYLPDLSNESNQERVIMVLIDQYEKKLKILRKIELEINRQKNEEGITLS